MLDQVDFSQRHCLKTKDTNAKRITKILNMNHTRCVSASIKISPLADVLLCVNPKTLKFR